MIYTAHLCVHQLLSSASPRRETDSDLLPVDCTEQARIVFVSFSRLVCFRALIMIGTCHIANFSNLAAQSSQDALCPMFHVPRLRQCRYLIFHIHRNGGVSVNTFHHQWFVNHAHKVAIIHFFKQTISSTVFFPAAVRSRLRTNSSRTPLHSSRIVVRVHTIKITLSLP